MNYGYMYGVHQEHLLDQIKVALNPAPIPYFWLGAEAEPWGVRGVMNDGKMEWWLWD